MTEFTVHTPETAPAASKPLLDNSVKAFGMIPNLHGVMAQSPQLLEAYQTIHGLFEATTLTATERTVVWQTMNVFHTCHYCVPAHTAIAHMQNVDGTVTEALRNGQPLEDTKLEALRQFTKKLIVDRGAVGQADVDAFLAAGYTTQNIMEVILGIAEKTMSNYTNKIFHTPVDEPFAKFDWTPPAAQAAE